MPRWQVMALVLAGLAAALGTGCAATGDPGPQLVRVRNAPRSLQATRQSVVAPGDPQPGALAVALRASRQRLPGMHDSDSSRAVSGAEPGFRQPVVAREATRARVLLYHSFGWFSQQRPAVTPYAFRVQLAWLRDHAVEVIRLSQLLDYLEGHLQLPERVAVITIDDAERNAYTVAYPLLQEFGFPFALAVPTEAVVRYKVRGTVTWAELREMLDSGLCELVSHSHTHPNLAVLDAAAVQRELELSRQLLQEYTGTRPEVFAYPLGAHSESVRELTRAAGYRAALLAQGAPVTENTPAFAIPRYTVEQHTSIFTFAYFFRHEDRRATAQSE